MSKGSPPGAKSLGELSPGEMIPDGSQHRGNEGSDTNSTTTSDVRYPDNADAERVRTTAECRANKGRSNGCYLSPDLASIAGDSPRSNVSEDVPSTPTDVSTACLRRWRAIAVVHLVDRGEHDARITALLPVVRHASPCACAQPRNGVAPGLV